MEPPEDRRKLVRRLQMFETMEWRGTEREGTDAEIEAMPLQKMKAVLLSKWDDLSHRSDFEPIKEDIAEQHKGELANFLSDLLSLKVNAEKDAAETRALFSFLSTYSLRGGGGGKGGGGCDDDDDDANDDPSGMHDDGPSENDEPTKEDAANGEPDETDTMGEAILRSEHGHHGFLWWRRVLESCGAQTT